MILEKGINTYVLVQEYRDIADIDFIIDSSIVITDPELENLLYNATSIFDNMFDFKYNKLDESQNLEFPRIGSDGTIYEINYDIEIVTARIAYYLKTDPSMFSKNSSDTNQQIKKEKMDVFETEYFEYKGNSDVDFLSKLDDHSKALIEKYLLVEDSVLGGTTFEYRTLI